jgi:hypothetical protein
MQVLDQLEKRPAGRRPLQTETVPSGSGFQLVEDGGLEFPHALPRSGPAHVQAQNGGDFVVPALEKTLGVKPAKQIFFAGKKSVDGGDGQRFAELSGARKKIDFAVVDEIQEVLCLVHIKVPLAPDLVESLDTDR